MRYRAIGVAALAVFALVGGLVGARDPFTSPAQAWTTALAAGIAGAATLPWGGASVSSGLGSAGASIGHHASVNDVRESAFEAAQRLVPTLASGEFATEVAVVFGARHARLGERRDVERPVQLAVSTAAEAMALDLPARHLKRRRPRVAGVVRARGEATDRSAAPHDLRRQDHADAGDARGGAALYAQRCLEAAAVRDEVAVQHPHLAHLWGAIIPNEANPDSDHSGSNIVALQADNALMESFFGTMQLELLDRKTWDTRAELASAIFEWIEGWYNPQRRHTSIDDLSPIDYERRLTTDTDAA